MSNKRLKAFFADDEIDPNAILKTKKEGKKSFIEKIRAVWKLKKLPADYNKRICSTCSALKVTLTNSDSDSADIAVELEDASFGWDSTSAEFLKNINLSVKKGELVAIVGKVGSGKSSVLSALLGEKTPQHIWQKCMWFTRNYLEN